MYEARQNKEKVSRRIGQNIKRNVSLNVDNVSDQSRVKDNRIYGSEKIIIQKFKSPSMQNLTRFTNQSQIQRKSIQYTSNMSNIYNDIPVQNVDVSLGYTASSPANQQWQHRNSTWHHIVPRNELKVYLQSIGNYLFKVSRFHNLHKSYAYDIINSILIFGDNIGFHSGIPTVKLGKLYYCISANGFLGPNSKNRTDDPHDKREKKPPYYFSLQQWNDIFHWVNRLSSLSSYIDANINIEKHNNDEFMLFLTNTLNLFNNMMIDYYKLSTYDAYITKRIEWREIDRNNNVINYSLI